MLLRLTLIGSVTLGFLFGLVTAVSAQTPQPMSSSHRWFCCTGPGASNKFLLGAPILKGGYFFNTGTVSVTGTSPASIMVPQSAIGVMTGAVLNPFPAPSVKSVTSMFSHFIASGTLGASGGVGSFSFCPSAVFGCTAPSQASPSPRNGRMYVKQRTTGPGAGNKFGGVMQLLGGPNNGGRVWRYPNYPSLNFQVLLYINQKLSGGGAPSAGFKAQNATGTTFTGTPATPSGLPPNGPNTFQASTRGVGPWTTGYVLLHITKNFNPPTLSVAVSGFDTRTPMGQGNIQLVSGAVHNSFGKAPATRPQAQVLTLPEPTSGLGLVAGALALVLFGLFGTRRYR